MVSLAGLSLHELEGLLSPLPKFRAKQIYQWIVRGVFDFDKMTDIPVSLQEELKSKYRVCSGIVDSVHDDNSARKIVISLKDNSKIEAVLLNDGKERYTACLSTQVGCPAGCIFCKTGNLGFVRNLECAEIIEQFFFLKDRGLHINDEAPSSISINNIVIMGMGEPLLNLTQLRKALSFFTDPNGINLSRRRITVSTCGICEGLFDLAQNGPYVRLALSLTTADEKLRNLLMPITRVNPLQKVKEALLLFQQKGGGRITFEIPLLGGINTRTKDAELAAAYAKGLDYVINIIPWNPVSGLKFNGAPLKEPDKEEIAAFIKELENCGLKTTMRYKKGRKVAGACGQLGTT